MALDWTEPIDLSTFSRRILAPALRSVGLPVSSPATPQRTRRDGTIKPPEPATRGVRFHDLRHTFAVLQLSAGVPFMQVSKWLGHSAFSITLDVYGDWIWSSPGTWCTTSSCDSSIWWLGGQSRRGGLLFWWWAVVGSGFAEDVQAEVAA